MSNADGEAQADEITALASIFEERIFVADDNNGGQFSAYLELPKEFFIKLEGPHIQQANKYGTFWRCNVRILLKKQRLG